jgi:sodium-coupled neutral amino acid transporter 10
MRRTPAAAGVHSGVPSSPPHDEELGASPFSDPSAHHGRASATPRRSSVDVALVGNPPGASSRPPDVDRDKAGGGVTTTLEASVNLANCIMGAGALSLPAFFRSCGVLLGVALLLVSCAWTWFSAVMMLKAADVVSARQLRGAPIASYEELMDLTLGARGKAASTVGILLLQVGCLVGYANILADVVSPFAVDILPPGLEPSRAAFIAAVTLGGMLPVGVLVGGDGGSPLLAAVSQFSIAVVGLFASAMAAHALAPAHYGGSAAARGPGSTTPTVTATGGSVPPIVWANFAGAMSVLPLAIFAFGAHPAVLPVVRSMKPWGLRPSTDVVTNVLKACAVGYLMIGLGGYLSFRSATAGNVLRNLDGQFLGSFGSRAIKFGYGLVILASVPTILLPLQKSARDAYLAMVAAGVIGNRRTKSVGQKTRTSPATDAEREKFLAGGGGGGGVVRSADDDVSPELAARISQVVAFGSMLAALFLSLYVPNVAFAFGLTGSTCSFLIAFVLPAMAYLSVTAAGPRAPRTRARGAKLETDPAVEMTAASVGAKANRDGDGDGDGEEILGGGGAAGVSITGASNRRGGGGGGGGGGASSGWEWFVDDDWGDDDDGWHSGGGTPPGGSPRSPVSRARAAPTPTTRTKTASTSASAPFAHRSDRASTRRWRLGARAQMVVATFLSVVCTQEVIREMLHEKKLVEVVAKIADAKVESDKIAAETKDISDAAAAFSASSAELEGAVAEATERINDAGAAAAAREKDEGGSREGGERADPADLDAVTKALADQLEAAMRAKHGEGERDDATTTVHDDAKVNDAKVDDAKPTAKLPAAFAKSPAGEPSPEASSSRMDAPAPPFPSPPLSDVDHHPVIPVPVAVASTSDPAAVGPSDGTDPSEEEDASAAAAESIKKVEVAVANATKAKAALEDALGLHDDEDEDDDDASASAAAAADDDDADDADGASAAADTPADRSSGASRDRATGKNRSDATADAVRTEDEPVSSSDVEGSDEDVVAAAEEKINALADAKAKVEEEASKELEKAVVEGVDEDLAKSLADMLPNITRG